MSASLLHSTFTIERDFKASPAQVFRGYADPALRRLWTDCHPDIRREHELDFRIGGGEVNRMTMPDGGVYLMEARFLDIRPDARIVYAYAMYEGARFNSASLVAVDFAVGAAGCRMTYTEQAAFADGDAQRAERIEGTGEGFDRLAVVLADADRSGF